MLLNKTHKARDALGAADAGGREHAELRRGIVNRLAAILPEETLPRLEPLRAERARVATLSIVAA